VPGRIKDFIAIPRNNFYKSLHTTVISEKGMPSKCRSAPRKCTRWPRRHCRALEVQGLVVSARDEQRLAWLRQVVEWQRDIKNSGEFLATLKIDLYPEEVYTFTPKGKIVILHETPPPWTSPIPCTPRWDTLALARK